MQQVDLPEFGNLAFRFRALLAAYSLSQNTAFPEAPYILYLYHHGIGPQKTILTMVLGIFGAYDSHL